MAQIELTRSSSDSSSLTSDGDHCKCAAQADEMHDQYLNRLEASFVTQLHRSTSWLARWPSRSMNRNISVSQQGKKASEQFTVFREGYMEKINFGRAITADSCDVLKSPWVKHFKHGDKPCSTGPPDANECSKTHHEENLLQDPRTSAHKIRRCSADMLIYVDSTSEGSGQNYVYEDCDNDATFLVKKLKLSVADTSSADQIVPSSEIDANIQPNIGKIPAEDQAHKSLSQSVSEEISNIPKPVLQSFQRGR